MRRVIIILSISFFIAMTLGVALGVARDSFRLGFILVRSLMSSLGVLLLFWLVELVVKYFLPELLNVVSEDKDDMIKDDEAKVTSEKDFTGDMESHNSSKKIDLMLNDFPIDMGEYGTLTGKAINTDIEKQFIYSDDNKHHRSDTEIFLGQDAQTLAQAVRTTLSRDDS